MISILAWQANPSSVARCENPPVTLAVKNSHAHLAALDTAIEDYQDGRFGKQAIDAHARQLHAKRSDALSIKLLDTVLAEEV